MYLLNVAPEGKHKAIVENFNYDHMKLYSDWKLKIVQ